MRVRILEWSWKTEGRQRATEENKDLSSTGFQKKMMAFTFIFLKGIEKIKNEKTNIGLVRLHTELTKTRE